MIIQAGLRIADIFAEAKHDAEFFGLHAEEAGQAPDHNDGKQEKADTEAAERAARQKLLHTVLGATEKIFQIGRPSGISYMALAARMNAAT